MGTDSFVGAPPVDITELVQRYGDLYYALIFVWTFLEGETVVLISGAIARSGAIDLTTLFVAAWGGSFLGDQLYFLIGRRWGHRLLGRFPSWRPRIARALRLIERHATVFVLTFRFVYGVRNVSSFAAGMSSLSWGRFAFLNFVAAGVWAAAFAGGGYLAGEAMHRAFGESAHGVGLVLLAAFLVVAVRLFHKASAEEEAPETEAAPAADPGRGDRNGRP